MSQATDDATRDVTSDVKASSSLFTGETPASRGFELAVLVAAVALAARTLLLPSAAAPGPVLAGWAGVLAVVLVIALTALGGIYPLPLGRKIHLSLGSGAVFATLLVFPPQQALLLAFAGTLIAQLVRRHRGYRLTPSTILFNQMQYLVTWSLVVAVYGRLRDDLGPPPTLEWLPVVAASAVYMLVNTWVVTTWTALRRRAWAWELWVRALREAGAGFAVSLLLGAAAARVAAVQPAVALPLVLTLVMVHWALSRMSRIRGRQLTAGLATLVEFTERQAPFLAEHSERVAWWAERLARHLGLPEDDVEAVAIAAKLHDLGKTLIRGDLSEKTGSLTEDEWTAMRQHPVLGAEVISRLPGLKAVAGYVRAHHERYDGQGYPDGLSGEVIPLGARIVTVADSFDAMVEARPYRETLPPVEALAQIAAGAGKQFDPRVARGLLTLAQPEAQDPRREDVPLVGALALLGAEGTVVPLGGPTIGRMMGEAIGKFGGAIEDFAGRGDRGGLQSLTPNPAASRGSALQLAAAQEAERARIARELHDEVGQELTGLKFILEAVPGLPAQKVETQLRAAQETVNDLMTRIHDLSLDLRPAMLDDLGLLPALLWHIERYAARTGVHVAFQHTGLERRLSQPVETAAYRIVQEALTNVARHSGAREATVRVWVDAEAGTLGLQIADQGQGCDLKKLGAGAAGGLPGMRERALLLKGHLEVESAPGAGTRVTAELPLEAGRERTLH